MRWPHFLCLQKDNEKYYVLCGLIFQCLCTEQLTNIEFVVFAIIFLIGGGGGGDGDGGDDGSGGGVRACMHAC